SPAPPGRSPSRALRTRNAPSSRSARCRGASRGSRAAQAARARGASAASETYPARPDFAPSHPPQGRADFIMRNTDSAQENKMQGSEHWTTKKTPAGDSRLFLWRKTAGAAANGKLLFIHGSSMASQPTFDLEVPGRPDSSVMEWFAARGFDTWCLDNEGYGRSDKSR